MPLPFEFTVEGPPVSQQARQRQRVREWMQYVQSAAGWRWDRESPFTGEIEVAITYFFDSVDIDVDNIPKPILDALAGLVYYNDSQVTDMICRKRDRRRIPEFPDPPQMVVEALAHTEQFLYIKVSEAQSEEM